MDLETSGVDLAKCGIVTASFKDHQGRALDLKVNPEVPIEDGATKVHGYSDESVKGFKNLGEYKAEIENYFKERIGYTLVGHNIKKFDLPILQNQFLKYDINTCLLDYKILDTLQIERYFYKMDLESVYRRYTGKDLETHHNSTQDVLATIDIHKGQMSSEKYLKTLEEIKESDTRYDFEGKLAIVDDKICWNIGKYKGKPIYEDLDYLRWAIKEGVLPKYLVEHLRKNYIN